MAVSQALFVITWGLIALADGCPTHHTDGISYVCEGDETCLCLKRVFNEQIATKILVFHPAGSYIITQDWTGSQQIYDDRASLKWIKDSGGDQIEFRLRNTTLKDDGVFLKIIYFNQSDYAIDKKRLHVLSSCPAEAMYRHPKVSYKTETSNATVIHHLAMTVPGNVTLWVTIPAADPPVQATVLAGGFQQPCAGKAEHHTECETYMQFDTSGDQLVTVTLTFVAWTPSTRQVYILKKDRQDVIPNSPTPDTTAIKYKLIAIMALTALTTGLTVALVICCYKLNLRQKEYKPANTCKPL